MGSDDSPIIDREGALQRLGGDEQLFSEMAQFVREDTPPLLNQLTAAVSASDAKTVRDKAHAIKGLVASCGGVRAAKAAQELENAGQSADLSRAESMLTELQAEIATLLGAL